MSRIWYVTNLYIKVVFYSVFSSLSLSLPPSLPLSLFQTIPRRFTGGNKQMRLKNFKKSGLFGQGRTTESSYERSYFQKYLKKKIGNFFDHLRRLYHIQSFSDLVFVLLGCSGPSSFFLKMRVKNKYLTNNKGIFRFLFKRRKKKKMAIFKD